MKPSLENAGALVLEDGQIFKGTLFGARVSPNPDKGYGEVVFNTSMTGYQEILTDPSYYGEIICMTVPHIGNVGMNTADPESGRSWCAGYLIHQATAEPSNWRAETGLEAFLKTNGIPGLYGIDTRALTRHLRSRGVLRGVILPESEISQAQSYFKKLPAFEGRDMIAEVSTKEAYSWNSSTYAKETSKEALEARAKKTGTVHLRTTSPDNPVAKKKLKVVAVDYGVKHNLLRNLAALGCEVEVVPAQTGADAILSRKPDGVFLSNGPGDPTAAPYAVEAVRGILGKVPVFGVCMGHQILSLAVGAKTFKLKFGHRGGNQPVFDQTTGRVEISSQNHGYAVDAATLPARARVTHINLNDKTVEGIQVDDAKAFSVQYHPEACPGPHDSMGLFGRFLKMMETH